MKKKLALLVTCLLIVLSMNIIFAEDPAVIEEPAIQDVEVTSEVVESNHDNLHYTFDAEDFEYEIDVRYNVESLDFTAKLDDEANLDNYEVVVDGETAVTPVIVDEQWVFDPIAIDLDLGINEVEVIVSYDPTPLAVDSGDEEETTYTYAITRGNVLKDLDVYVDDMRVDLNPEFDSNTTSYDKLITMPEDIILDFDLDKLIANETYKVVITHGSELIFESEDQDSLDDADVTLADFVYGINEVTIAIERDTSENDTPLWLEIETYALTFEVASLESITLESVDEGESTDVLEDVTIIPDFAGDVLAYTALVGYEVDSLNISALLIVDAENTTDEDSTVAVEVADSTTTTTYTGYESGDVVNYEFDENITIDVIVTVTNGDSEIVYTVTVTKVGRLETLEFSYDDGDIVVLDMTPEFDSTDQEYVVEVLPYDVDVNVDADATVAVVAVEATLPTEFAELDIYVDDELYNPLDNLIAVGFGEQVVAIEIRNGDDVVEAYEVTFRRPVPLSALDVEPIGDYGFVSSDFIYNNLKVENEVDEVVLTPTAVANANINIDGDLLKTTNSIVELDYGKNTIVVMTEYEGVTLEYVLRITREGDEEIPLKDMNRYRYTHTEMGLKWEDNDLGFDPNLYGNIINAFKWGNNQNNEIVVEVDDKTGTITIPYHIYKFMVQRKVTLVLDDHVNVHRIELGELKLSRYIKGPNALGVIVLDFEIDHNMIKVHNQFEGYEYFNKHFDKYNDDDDDDDDDDVYSNNNGKIPPGRNK